MKFTLALTLLSVFAAASARSCTPSGAQLHHPAAAALLAGPAAMVDCFAHHNGALSKAAETSFNLTTV
ncbi:hypothetical protein HYALB_00013305 [Hymenoscyphus albidus]|uniref:Uncharacterized protein n=1 Tax=Hymenoscyphus albidus TaxID=595503 RepID=A0A9N9QBW5_9HELO|nr:hypothetical protein HYALB_00013305 [Hymenoscyphus albidus]